MASSTGASISTVSIERTRAWLIGSSESRDRIILSMYGSLNGIKICKLCLKPFALIRLRGFLRFEWHVQNEMRHAAIAALNAQLCDCAANTFRPIPVANLHADLCILKIHFLGSPRVKFRIEVS